MQHLKPLRASLTLIQPLDVNTRDIGRHHLQVRLVDMDRERLVRLERGVLLVGQRGLQHQLRGFLGLDVVELGGADDGEGGDGQRGRAALHVGFDHAAVAGEDAFDGDAPEVEGDGVEVDASGGRGAEVSHLRTYSFGLRWKGGKDLQ